MAATNFTPISLYYTTTAAATPSAGNLVAGELALNTLDEKLYFKNSAGTVKLLASNAGSAGSVTSVAMTVPSVLSISGSPITSSGTLALTYSGTALPVANGGTGLASGTSGGVLAYTAAGTLASSSALAASALVIGGGAGAAPSTTTTGTGVVTALGVNIGTAGAFVVNGGALGTPSSGTVTNLTGTASININGTVGATTATTGAFTSLTASTTLGVTGVSTLTAGAVVQGLTVGLGAGAVSSNTAVGASALAANTTGAGNTAIGDRVLNSNITGSSNVGIGQVSLFASTGDFNTAIGAASLRFNTTASNNTAVGYQAGYTATGRNNTFVGIESGKLMTTGIKNTILGAYNGNTGGLDIRTASNYIVLSDGDGNPLISTNSTGSVALNGAVPQTGTGITFPATQSASSNANTLDDYEEGTTTVTFTPSTSGTITLNASYNIISYIKIGRVVTVTGEFFVNSVSSPVGTSVNIGNLPFSAGSVLSDASGFGILDLGTGGAIGGRVYSGGVVIDLRVNASTITTNYNIVVGFSYITST